ncbi:MAG: sigma-70 family RNA polymerase sigma factor [Bacteroidales bacterium]|jgi:RNA polymerase sigma-70 factor (ECF subfamily)|nr:sigma-70 family RNA polymerase sigma factor [Bacteroidales bacterium]
MGKGTTDSHEYSDSDLVKRCADGDIRSQELLYRRYFSFAMSISIRYTRDENEAMETVNDSYMKVLDRLPDYDHSRPFKSWYGKIVVNTAIDNYRKNLKNNDYVSIDTVPETGESEPEIETELSVDDILKLYRYMPVNYKVTFNLFEIEGYSHEEIGRMTGVTASTSRANLARAKKLLRELYNRHILSVKKGHE